MKKTKLQVAMCLILTLVLFPICFGLKAQEFKNKASEQGEQADEAVDVRDDAGVEAVQQAQADKGPKHQRTKTAEEMVSEWMKEFKWREGWDPVKKRLFRLDVAEREMEDPAYQKGFFIIRDALAKEAVLRAKGNIIATINQEVSAKDMLRIPGSDLHAQFAEEVRNQELRLKAQRRVVVALLREKDIAAAKALEGATTRDRINALMDAAIKKLDKSYSAKNIEKKKRDKYNKAKERYRESIDQLNKIDKQAEALRGKLVSEFSSEFSKHAAMPLFGATVIAQAESWDPDSEKYQVCVLQCWSIGLEEAARATLLNKPVKMKAKKDKLSLEEWIQEQDLSAMIGPRQYLDNRGTRHFIGISSRKVNTPNFRDFADSSAEQMALFSLMSDMRMQQTAKQLMQTKAGGAGARQTTTQAAETLSKTISAEIVSKTIRGSGRVHFLARVKHPLVDANMFVSVYAVNQEAAKASMSIEDRNYATAVLLNKHQAFEDGRKDGLEAVIRASKNSPKQYREGYEKALKAVEKKLAKAKPPKPLPGGIKRTPRPKPGPTTGGAAGNKPKPDDDF